VIKLNFPFGYRRAFVWWTLIRLNRIRAARLKRRNIKEKEV
jgi:hypothetical protein